MKTPRPSFIRTGLNDYVTYVCLVFPAICCVVILANFVFTSAGTMLLLFVLVLTSLITTLIAGIRFISILKIFHDNQEVMGVISRIDFYRDRGRVEFVYIYQGAKFTSGLSIMKNRRTAGYQPGDEVFVLVDRNNPRKALIKDLYQ
ncbi:MAG: DUF3592 domain-containing protein [Leptolinea sp.]|jgi:hypothetical protein|nr:DUF3592 domain-containing protein [Leptolinea sp.]